MRKIFFYTLLSAILIPNFLSAQKKIDFPQGAFQNTTAADFEARNMQADHYNELWTYHINLENGVQVIYTFSINDFGSFKSRVTGAKLIVSWKDGKTYVINKEYDVEDLITKPEDRYLRLKSDRPFWAKGKFNEEHTVNFQSEKDGVAYNLNLSLYDIAEGKKLGNGVYNVDGNEIGIFMLIPHAKVKGYVEINGERIEAKGTAYMDHFYVNNASTKIINKSYRVKSGDDENGVTFHFMSLKDGSKNTHIGYGVHYMDGTPRLISPSTIEAKENTKVRGVKLEKELLVKPFQMDALDLKVNKHLNTYSIMDELNGFQKFFAKRVIGGELIEMNGTLEVDNDKEGYFYYLVTDG